MWTYLAIFFSFAVLFGVFAWRAYAFLYKKALVEEGNGESEKMDEAPVKAKRVSSDDKEKVEELCKEGEAKLKIGKEDEAIKLFIQALAINEVHLEAQHKLAMLYMKKQMFSAACALFKNLGELTGDAVHYSHLGLALFQQNLLEEAKDAYQKSVELDPSRPQRFSSLAQVYRALGQLQNAVIALNKAVEIDEANLDFLFLLVDIQIELKNFAAAKELIEKIQVVDPESEHAKESLKILKEVESGQ